jgi:C-terminal processing protease CtpA/Prc
VPYLARIGDALWVEGPDADGMVFAQYNRVDLIGLGDLTTAIANPETTTLVFDIRHNFGGEVSAIEPVIDVVSQFADEHPESTYVITGRNTFSAASLLTARLDAETDAQIVGSAMGGCPTAWGDPEELALPYSGIDVSVSTFFEVGVDAADPRLTIEPDIPAPLTPEEWASGADPALDAIRAQSQ